MSKLITSKSKRQNFALAQYRCYLSIRTRKVELNFAKQADSSFSNIQGTPIHGSAAHFEKRGNFSGLSVNSPLWRANSPRRNTLMREL